MASLFPLMLAHQPHISDGVPLWQGNDPANMSWPVAGGAKPPVTHASWRKSAQVQKCCVGKLNMMPTLLLG